MSLKPEKPRKRSDQLLGYFKRVFRSRPPSPSLPDPNALSTYAQSDSATLGAQADSGHDGPSSTFNVPAQADHEVGKAGSPSEDNYDSLSTDLQSPAEYEQLLKPDLADIGSPSASDRDDRPQSPINFVPVNHQKTGKSTMAETVITAVRESLNVVAQISAAFPPLQTVAGGLVAIFDRIDASLFSSNSVIVG
jgi:hypothetical protein